MGWLWLALLGAGAMAGMAALGLSRRLWSFAGSALMLGAAGYALQGRPDLPGRAAQSARAAAADDAGMVALRDRLFGTYSQDHAYAVAADAVGRSGDARAAVRAYLGGLNRLPNSVALWTGLGGAYAAHDRSLSPAARLAFDRAIRLAPEHPGPAFFLGLAYVRGDDLPAARRWWARALALSPAGTDYRREIAVRLLLLDRVLAEGGGRTAADQVDR